MSELLLLLFLTVLSGPMMQWEALPNRTIEIKLPDNRRIYHTIIEIGYCGNMQYVGPNENILRAGNQCYKVSTEPFEIRR